MQPGVAQVGMGAGVAAPTVERCRLCGAAVTSDPLGFTECSCGWEGPGDPLEMGHGLGRTMRRLDRKLASAQARNDLKRLVVPGVNAARIGAGYAVLLFLASTCIYLLLYAALVACAYFGYRFALEQAWVGLVLCVLGVCAVLFMLYRRPTRPKGIEATPERFPHLAAALTEVSQRIGAPVPDRIVLTPHAHAFSYVHRPPRRLFRRERVLGLGIGALPLLSEVDLKAILAHELAHHLRGGHSLKGYFAGAEAALARLAYLLRSNPYAAQRMSRGGSIGRSGAALGDLVMALLTLPVRAVWMLFHLLRLRESRMAEFAADRVAAQAYGALSFINALSGMQMASNTLRGAGQSLTAEMRKHGGANLYAELRNHYAALPPALISQLRVKAAQDFRTLQRTHPSTPDRLRAVYALGIHPPSEPYRPAIELLVPAGATSADEVEAELTKLLLK